MTCPVIEGMRERGFGRIVSFSSINDQKGQIGQTNYAASKAGDIGFTKSLAQELAGRGITVNAVCSGYIATNKVKAVPKEVLEKSYAPLSGWWAGRIGRNRPLHLDQGRAGCSFMWNIGSSQGLGHGWRRRDNRGGVGTPPAAKKIIVLPGHTTVVRVPPFSPKVIDMTRSKIGSTAKNRLEIQVALAGWSLDAGSADL